MSNSALAPIYVGADATPDDYPTYVAALLEAAYAKGSANGPQVTRQNVLDTFVRLSARGRGDIFLDSFVRTTAMTLMIKLPTVFASWQPDGMALVMVSRDVFEAGVRVWVLRDEAADE